ncbi:hypothetical protein [Phormidesmis priestleyi]|uniref:hypothetical protein n=1 Tax=Phormidesmis priestleyi TaxID=268141 RepID=UPI0011B28E97|nr:hypothetical protein [Phormidesmis priestleyi]
MKSDKTNQLTVVASPIETLPRRYMISKAYHLSVLDERFASAIAINANFRRTSISANIPGAVTHGRSY